jgi:hypothetical protein
MNTEMMLYTSCFNEELFQYVESGPDSLRNRVGSKEKTFIKTAMHNTEYSQTCGRLVYIGVALRRETCVGLCTVKVQRVGRKHWGRYATLTYILILERFRREGLAYELATFVLSHTCVPRFKALAASIGGLALFNKMDCVFWGLTKDGKGIIDTQLNGKSPFLIEVQPPYAKYFGGTNKPVTYKKMVKLFNAHNKK